MGVLLHRVAQCSCNSAEFFLGSQSLLAWVTIHNRYMILLLGRIAHKNEAKRKPPAEKWYDFTGLLILNIKKVHSF